MDLLNEITLASLLSNCYRNRYYRACILFDNNEDAHTLLNELVEIHRQDGIDGVRSFQRSTPAQIRFGNGSSLTLLTASDETRGLRFHKALLHENVMNADAMLALQHNIREYIELGNETLDTINKIVQKTPNNTDVEIKVDRKSTKALDDFLGSFRINDTLEFGA